jgi:hypothetical protein
MTHGNEIPATYRPHRSEFDDRAIDMTAHLLLGLVSLERRMAAVPKQLSALVETAGRNGSTGRLWGPIVARSTDDES